jgi:RHS repeat-associated protein
VQGQIAIYDDQGNSLNVSGIGNDITYTGRRLDQQTGNYYYRARYYNPVLGRFISRDPLSAAEFKEGTNLYAYVRNNSPNLIDPSGLASASNHAGKGNACEEGQDDDSDLFPDFDLQAMLQSMWQNLTGSAAGMNPIPMDTFDAMEGLYGIVGDIGNNIQTMENLAEYGSPTAPVPDFRSPSASPRDAAPGFRPPQANIR